MQRPWGRGQCSVSGDKQKQEGGWEWLRLIEAAGCSQISSLEMSLCRVRSHGKLNQKKSDLRFEICRLLCGDRMRGRHKQEMLRGRMDPGSHGLFDHRLVACPLCAFSQMSESASRSPVPGCRCSGEQGW